MELPRIAVAQPEMAWTMAENVDTAVQMLAQAAEREAEMVLFPELMLTGLHTHVPELLDPTRIVDGLDSVARACRAHGVATAIGAPVSNGATAKPGDALVLLDANGRRVHTWHKMRLMPPGEPMLFAAGTSRPSTELAGCTMNAIFCREVLDRDDLETEVAAETDVVLWPGMMARPPHDPGDPHDYLQCAIDLAASKGVAVFHSNWATNVDAPHVDTTGQSVVITSGGTTASEAPPRLPGLLLGWMRDRDAWVGT